MRAVFVTFLRLGLTSFGGPIAHLGYFRREFVERRRWIDERLFAQIVALCTILPGPTSSQVGMIVGLVRAGPAGALLAWLGFTLPSAVALTFVGLLVAAAHGMTGGSPRWVGGVLTGLAAAATAIVAQAVLSLAKTQCTDRATQTIALGAAGLAIALAAEPGRQWVPIAAGALAGARFCRRRLPSAASAESAAALPIAVAPGASLAAGALFAALVVAAAFGSRLGPAGLFLATIVRAGSLVFGGGHVVLPLLAALVPAGLVSSGDFYAGYGAAQAVPGPLFTFAAFLGAVNRSPLHGVAGAIVATGLIFVPSFLLVFAVWPIFGALRTNRAAAGALQGASASVVGLLGALLYAPLILDLGASGWRIALALGTFTLVEVWKIAPWIAVAAAAVLGASLAAAGLLA